MRSYVVANEKSRLRKSKVKYSKSKVKFYDLFQANWVFGPNVHLWPLIYLKALSEGVALLRP